MMLDVHALASRCGWKLYTCSEYQARIMWQHLLHFVNVHFQGRRILPVSQLLGFSLVSSLVPTR